MSKSGRVPDPRDWAPAFDIRPRRPFVIRLKRWTRPRRLPAVLAAAVCVLSAVACTAQPPDKRPQAPGPEIDSDQGGAYGWHKAMAIGTRFTDGLIHLELSGASTSPMKIISIAPLMDDGPALRVLGIRVRVIPDMLPENSER